MVGNISDMNADVAIRQYRPNIPPMKIVPVIVSIAPAAKTVSIRLDLKYFIRYVLISRLERKMDIAIIL